MYLILVYIQFISIFLVIMDSKFRAKKLYDCMRNPDEDSESVSKVSETLQQVQNMIMQFLCACSESSRFQFQEFITVIGNSSCMPGFHPQKASNAFEKLELYIWLVMRYQWKTEYKTIRKYCGFYQSKINAHLKGAEDIFKLVGYQDIDGVLTLLHPAGKEELLNVGFECIVASVECSIIYKAHKRLMDSRISFAHIVKVRSKNSGDVERLVGLVETEIYRNRGNPLDAQSVLKNKLENKSSSENSPSSFVDTNQNPGTSAKSKQSDVLPLHIDNLPYADEDGHIDTNTRPEFSEGTMDEHLMASLQLVNQESQTQQNPQSQVQLSGSEEWSFVRRGLHNKFGPDYNLGQRGSVLKDEIDASEERDILDSSVVRMRNSKQKDKDFPTSVRDSGYVGSSVQQLSEQHVFYPPMTAMPSEHSDYITGNSSAVNYALPSPRSTTRPVSLSSVAASRTYPHPNTGKPWQTASNDLYTTTPPAPCSGAPIHSSDVIYKGNIFADPPRPHPTSGYNASHSAPVMSRPRTAKHEVYVQQPIRPPSIHNSLEWKCGYCTIMNENHLKVCNVCGKSRDMDQVESLRTTKQCLSCTFANPPDAVSCEVCQGTALSVMHSNV